MPRLESILRDVAFATRLWRRNKLVTGAAPVSLSRAVGACTAAFTLIDALIFRILPVDDPQSLIYVALRVPTEDRDGLAFNYPLFRQMRTASSRQVRLFALSDQAKRDAVFDDRGHAEKIYAQWVSGEASAILGVKPALGRMLASTDDINPGQHPVAVLSYDFWTRRFGRNPDALGRWVTIREKPLQIVGVAANGFTGVEPGIMTDVWAPTMMWDDRAIADSGSRWFRIWGQMQAGVAQEQARTVLQTIFTGFAREQVASRPEESPTGSISRLTLVSICGPPRLVYDAPGDRAGDLRRDRMTKGSVWALVQTVLWFASSGGRHSSVHGCGSVHAVIELREDAHELHHLTGHYHADRQAARPLRVARSGRRSRCPCVNATTPAALNAIAWQPVTRGLRECWTWRSLEPPPVRRSHAATRRDAVIYRGRSSE